MTNMDAADDDDDEGLSDCRGIVLSCLSSNSIIILYEFSNILGLGCTQLQNCVEYFSQEWDAGTDECVS